MPTKPKSVEIRAYQVGFGDCFLVSFVYPQQKKRHILIDFGSTGMPSGLTAAKQMKAVALDIKKECGGQLTAVIASHRHRDHISGFSTSGKDGGAGQIIADCKPKLVLQPWTEDPKAAKNARRATTASVRSSKSFVAGLSAMHRVAEAILRIGQSPPKSVSLETAKQLRFLGMDNIKNKSAVENLIRMGKQKGAKAVFANHGSKSGLEGLLPGVKVHVLGPPDLTQTEKIRKMRSSDPDEFWQLLGGRTALNGMSVAEGAEAPVSKGKGQKTPIPAQARWFCARLAAMTGEQLLEIVRVLDDQMNNTSLILLFEVGKKKLLFPGDAQIENWSWALQDAKNAAATRKLLAAVDMYKVGHHGSRNATPKELLWENFSKRNKPKGKRLLTMLSTLPGKHGKTKSKTEVPRKTLLDALVTETELLNTDALLKAQLCQLLSVKA
jgi:hypothetical protein